MPPPQPRVNEKRNFQKNFEKFLEFLNFCCEKFEFFKFLFEFLFEFFARVEKIL